MGSLCWKWPKKDYLSKESIEMPYFVIKSLLLSYNIIILILQYEMFVKRKFFPW